MLQNFCECCFAWGQFRYQCVEERARHICGQCANAVSSGKESQEDPARLGFLLALTATVGAAIMERADAVARNDTEDAVRVSWAPSQANEKPFMRGLT